MEHLTITNEIDYQNCSQGVDVLTFLVKQKPATFSL